MSNTDLPNNNFYDQEQTSNKQVTDMLAQFMNPSMAGWLSSVIQGGLRNFAFSDATGMPGLSFGQAALFGPSNAAHEMYGRIQKDGLVQLTRATEVARNESMHNLRDNVNRLLFSTADPTELARRNMGFNIPNMVSDWLLNTATGAKDFERYRGQTGMLAGYATAPVLESSDPERIGAFMARQRKFIEGGMYATTGMQRSNIMYGVSGGDLGKMRMEMARTGMMGVVPGMSQQDYTQNVTKTFQAWASTVEPLRQFFGNDVTAGMDQLSSLLGVSALPTFGDEAGNMLRGLRASGRVLGYSDQQMMNFAAQSSQTAKAFGLDQFGALEQGRIAATTFRAATSLPDALRYVNEQSLRETIVQRTVGAGGSTMSRVIAGAATNFDEAKRAEFLANITMTGASTNDEIVALANDMGVKGSVTDFLNASRTNEAKDIMATGRPTGIVLKRNLNRLERDRRRLLTERFKDADISGMANMSVEELRNSGLGRTERGIIQGMWDEQASGAGYKDANELDAALSTVRFKDFIDSFEARTDKLRKDDVKLQSFMRQGLAGSVFNAITRGGGKEFKALEAIVGQTGAERMAIAATMGEDVKALAQIAEYEKDPALKATYQSGMTAFMEMFAHGTIAGKKVDAADVAEYKRRIAGGEGGAEVLQEIADLANPRAGYRRKAKEMMRSGSMSAVEGETPEEKMKRAETIQFLTAMSKDETIEGLEEGADTAAIQKRASAFIGKFKAGGLTDKDIKEFKQFSETISGYIATDKDVANMGGGYASQGFGGSEGILQRILDVLTKAFGGENGGQAHDGVAQKEIPKKGATP